MLTFNVKAPESEITSEELLNGQRCGIGRVLERHYPKPTFMGSDCTCTHMANSLALFSHKSQIDCHSLTLQWQLCQMSDSCVTNVCQYLAPSDATDRADKSCLANSDVEPLFSKAVDQMDGHISKVKNRMFLPLIDSLFAFVRQNSLTNQMREKSFETKFTANTGLIPTALLSLGI